MTFAIMLAPRTQAQTSPAVPGFDTIPTFSAGAGPTSLAQLDMNGDGVMDLVVANYIDNTLWFYTMDGGGHATEIKQVALAGGGPIEIKVLPTRLGNLLVVLEDDSDTLEILQPTVSGYITQKLIYLPGLPTHMAFGDFRGDGHTDLAIGQYSEASGAFLILYGMDNGELSDSMQSVSFTKTIAIGSRGRSDWIEVADFNHDGKSDIVVLDGIPTSDVFLSTGTDFSELGTQSIGSGGFGFISATSGDLNADGCTDLVVETVGLATVLSGNCDGTFSFSQDIHLADTGSQMVLVDMNHDGILDLVIAGDNIGDGGGGAVPRTLVTIYLGHGDGSFSAPRVFRALPWMNQVTALDVNGDGNMDIVAAGFLRDEVGILLGDGAGGLRAPPAIHGTMASLNATPRILGFADLNGDGLKDIVFEEVAFSGTHRVGASLNEGLGQFSDPVYSSPFPPNAAMFSSALADFHHTGKSDLVVAALNQSQFFSGLFYLRSQGDGTFAAPINLGIDPNDFQPSEVCSGDVNGDGNPDLVFVDNAGRLDSSHNFRLHTLVGDADGNFSKSAPRFIIPRNPTSEVFDPAALYCGDFNGDGKMDIVVGEQTRGIVDFYFVPGDGRGGFLPESPVTTPRLNAGVSQHTVGDFDGDGVLDLLVVEATDDVGSSELRLYSGAGSRLVGSTIPMTFPGVNTYLRMNSHSGLISSMAGDYNGDGKMNIAIPTRPIAGSNVIAMNVLQRNGSGQFELSGNPIYLTDVMPGYSFDADNNGRADLVELDGWTNTIQVIRSVPGSDLAMNIERGASDGVLHLNLSKRAVVDTTVALTASDTSVLLPTSTTISAGQTALDVPFTYAGDSDPHTVTMIVATTASGNASANAYRPVMATSGFPPANLSLTNQVIFPMTPSNTAEIQTITLHNGGSTTGVISFITVGFGASTSFSQTNDCAGTLAPGQVCHIQIRFAPDHAGQFTQTLTVASNASNGILLTSLVGIGHDVLLSLDATTLDFNAVLVNANSARQVRLTNITQSPVAVTSIATSGGFTQSNKCPSMLASGQSCIVQIMAKFALPGVKTGTLTVLSSDPSVPYTTALSANAVNLSLMLRRTSRAGRGSVASSSGHSTKKTDMAVQASGNATTFTMSCLGADPRLRCTLSQSSFAGGESTNVTVRLSSRRSSRLLGGVPESNTFTLKIQSGDSIVMRTFTAQFD